MLKRCLGDAVAGFGTIALVDGPAGAGKSRLISVAGDLARESGFHVLGARATELERDFPFGVVIQLFEPLWTAADAGTRQRLLAGPACRAAELLDGGVPYRLGASADEPYPVIHALFSLARNLTALQSDQESSQPLLILVDDVHWADRASLRFLAYLAERSGELPIAMVLGARATEMMADAQAGTALRIAASGMVLRLAPLSPVGVAGVTRSKLPEAGAAFIAACVHLTSGNPFLLVKLLEHVAREGHRPDAATARRLTELTPDSVVTAIVAQLRSLPAEVGALARGLSIFGDGATLAEVSTLAQLSPAQAVSAADTLAALNIVHPGSPLSFAHPLIASAVRVSIAPLDRELAHRRAASILLDGGSSPDRVAAQLLNAQPDSDPRAVDALRASARNALAGGAPDTAARLLARALAERPDSAECCRELQAELAEAEAAARLPSAIEHLERAIELATSDDRRTQLKRTLAQSLIEHHRFEEAAELLLSVTASGLAGPLTDDFDALLFATARVVPKVRQHARDRGRDLVARLDGDSTPAQRWALAEVALNAALSGEPRAAVSELVERAWREGGPLESHEAETVRLLSGALLFIGELERDLELCEAALRLGGQDSEMAKIARSCRVWPLYEQGRIDDALAEAAATLSEQPEGWSRLAHMRTTYAALGLCLIQHGELERAETALSILDHPDVSETLHHPHLLDARARLRLAQMRPRDALEDALEAGRLAEEFAITTPGAVQWRSTAALAHLTLGHQTEARRLAREELAMAQQLGVTRVAIRATRCLGLAERGKQRIDILRGAAELGADGPPRLEHIEALVAYGGALRRANRRAAARTPLHQALELARAGGAMRLAATAHAELASTGVRARRSLLTGVESLTPSELRVAQLAASGRTTREMAEALFVTRKTIEYHLRQIYRKLDIGSRDQLPAALGLVAEG